MSLSFDCLLESLDTQRKGDIFEHLTVLYLEYPGAEPAFEIVPYQLVDVPYFREKILLVHSKSLCIMKHLESHFSTQGGQCLIADGVHSTKWILVECIQYRDQDSPTHILIHLRDTPQGLFIL